jgi:hypothetical protein
MGVDRTVRFPIDETPTWDAIRHQLSRLGVIPSLRLIDGLPAFPNETPASDWKELRIATEAGMVTIRRGPCSLNCVIWGNADAALEAAWSAVTWACASAGNGLIDSSNGAIPPDEFARLAGLTPE